MKMGSGSRDYQGLRFLGGFANQHRNYKIIKFFNPILFFKIKYIFVFIAPPKLSNLLPWFLRNLPLDFHISPISMSVHLSAVTVVAAASFRGLFPSLRCDFMCKLKLYNFRGP